MSFPAHISELTTDWLNETFARRGLLDGRKIVRFDSVPASGRGGTSSVHVLTLTYDDPGGSAPTQVLAKFSSESEAVREAVRAHRLYPREIAFYARYGANPGIPTPACYAAEFDERANTCVLLLEYFAHAHSRDVNTEGVEDVEKAVRCLAPFHAQWWGAALDGIDHACDLTVVEQHRSQAARAFARIKDGGHRGEMGEASYAILELWLAHARPLAEYARSRPLTMCHGSFHRGQILFPDQGGGLPWVIDWQNVAIHNGANDLARIVVTGLLPGQRRQHERRLVDLYHVLLEANGVRGYSREQFRDDYRLGVANLIVFHSLMLADYSIATITKHWKGPASFWEMLFHWPGATAEEWDVVGWLAQTIRSLPAPR